jgi:hypothetical protein
VPDLRPDLFSFPVGQYVLFYREQPGNIVNERASSFPPLILSGAEDLVPLETKLAENIRPSEAKRRPPAASDLSH